jgi:hypothetical protein
MKTTWLKMDSRTPPRFRRWTGHRAIAASICLAGLVATGTAGAQQSMWFQTSGDTPFATCQDPGASLQLGNPTDDPRVVNIDDVIGVRNADGGMGYGKVPDPLGNGDGQWILHRVIRADADSHGTTVKRSEESSSRLLALGDDIWVVFEWYTPPNAGYGLGQLTARSSSDIDSATLFQVHAPSAAGYDGADPYVSITVQASMARPYGYRVINVPDQTQYYANTGSTPKFHPSARPQWQSGTPGTYLGANGTSDPNWPTGSVGVKEAWVMHMKFHYAPGQYYTRAWLAKRGGPMVQILNNTTTPNMPDISKSGGSPTAIGYIKDGIYAFNIPANLNQTFDWRTYKRHFQVLRNLVLPQGITEDKMAALLIAQTQSH